MTSSRALISGSRSGLGKALGDLLETKGYTVLRHSSSEVDLTTTCQPLIDLIEKEKPDILVNNAGIGFYGSSLDIPLEDHLKTIELNQNALVTLSLAFAKTCIAAKKPGTILNISSAAALLPFPYFNTYAASKAFVNQFSLALNTELKPHNIHVLCACPGQIATNFRYRAAKGHPQKPDRRTMSPETGAQHLYQQLLKKKPLYIFDWRTKALINIAKLLPQRLLQSTLKKSIKQRIQN
ncbi:MAG: SDR family NAD(P)-dependent oxidoreductase [Simkaniaceae bacterium]|nr:SDR family NAD(P)-dependent oxidoreductase [Candidatus Sacchlamyda saccharinae]